MAAIVVSEESSSIYAFAWRLAVHARRGAGDTYAYCPTGGRSRPLHSNTDTCNWGYQAGRAACAADDYLTTLPRRHLQSGRRLQPCSALTTCHMSAGDGAAGGGGGSPAGGRRQITAKRLGICGDRATC